MTEPRRVTRRDVARLAGVSDAVVSYTLSGRAPVAAATAARVRAAIAELGYQPNAAARALRSGSSRTIALLAPVGGSRIFANPFFTELASAVEDAARDRGLDLLLSTSTPDESALRTRMSDLAARQVDGVLLLAGGAFDRSAIDAFGLPWLLLNSMDRADEGIGIGIGVDLRAGAFLATSHLASLGRRRIAFVGETGTDAWDRPELRRSGWEDGCHAAGVEPGPAIEAEYSREGGLAAGRFLTELPERPDAVVAASDLIAIGLLRALRDAHVRVPEDVAVVGFDGTWEGEYSAPPLTSVRQPLEAMAETALDRLAGIVSGPTLFAGELIVRASSGASTASKGPRAHD